MTVEQGTLLGAFVLGFALLIATFIEGAVEIVAGKAVKLALRPWPKDHIVHEWAGWGLQMLSIVVGIGVVFLTSLDIFGFAAEQFRFYIDPIMSKCMTGFIVGRGASGVHDIWKLIGNFKAKEG